MTGAAPARTGEWPEIGLVIFDCDGVLVDSEPLALDVLRETLAARGTTIDPDVAYERFLGRSLSAVCEMLATDYDHEVDAATLDALREALYARFRAELRPAAGIFEALDGINVPVCVASSSHLERLDLTLAVTGLHARFAPHIFSASQVENGKPAPDLFLFAARRMGVPPARCLVIEDSPAGIAAARAAGMAVLGYTGASHAGPARLAEKMAALGPDRVFDDFHRLPDLLSSGRQTPRSG